MSLLRTCLLSTALVFSLLNGIRAFYKESDTCSFTEIGKPTCIGPGTTVVADYARSFVGTAENYAVGWHPCGLILLAKTNIVGATSLAMKLRFNGIYGYVNEVEGAFYFFATIGCKKPYVLSDKDEYLPGFIDLTSSQLYKIVVHLVNGSPYKTACNNLPMKTLYGPSPNAPEDFPLANFYLDISNLQSAHIVTNNHTGYDFTESCGCGSKSGISVTTDRDTIILSQTIAPIVRKCKRKVFSLVDPTKGKYPEISSLKPNSACFWATLVNELFTGLIVDRFLYTFWAINKIDGSGVFYFEGYMPSNAVDQTFDPMYYSFC